MASAQDILRKKKDDDENRSRLLADIPKGAGELALQLLTGIPASLAGGFAGAVSGAGSAIKHGVQAKLGGKTMSEALREGLSKGGDELLDTYRGVSEPLTYEPKSESGQRGSEAMSKGLEKLAEHTVDPIGEKSPELGTLAVVLANAIGPKGAKGKKGKGKGPKEPKEPGTDLTPQEVLREAPEDVPAIDVKTGATRRPQAPREISMPARFQSGENEGIIRGTEGLGGITPQRATGQRNRYLGHMERGAEERLWYDKTSEDLFRISGENVPKADRLATMMAITSSDTKVPTNTMFGIRGMNQAAVGDPIKTGKYWPRMSADIVAALRDPDIMASGFKRSPYNAGLTVKWRGPENVDRATHDIRDVRAWGITDPKTGGPWKKGVSEAGHRFLDEQSQKVTDQANRQVTGGFNDWNKYRAQAAAWISQKAEQDGTTIQEAARHYGDYLQANMAMIPRENVPGRTVSHKGQALLPELLDAPLDVQQQVSDALEAIKRGPQGTDKLALEMGALSERSLPNAGLYKDYPPVPGAASQIPIGREEGKPYNVDPSSKKLVRGISHAHSAYLPQDQVSWNALTTEAPIKRAGAYRINTGAPMSEAELLDLRSLLRSLKRPEGPYGDLNLPMVDQRGARVLEFGEVGDKWRNTVVDALRGKYPGKEVMGHNVDTELLPDPQPKNFTYQNVVDAVRGTGPEGVAGFNRASKTIAPQTLAELESVVKTQGWQALPRWYRIAMQALERGGIDLVEKLVKRGTIPVFFLTLLDQSGGSGEDAAPPGVAGALRGYAPPA